MKVQVSGLYLTPAQRLAMKPAVRRVEPKANVDGQAVRNDYVYDLEQRIAALQKENMLLSVVRK